MNLENRYLYLCTPIRPDFEQFLSNCIKGGVDIVQLRDKTADAKQIIKYSHKAIEICNEFGVPFILNDRPDIALEVKADGVHLGQDDVPVSLARKILGPEAIIGLSTHSEKELRASLYQQTDYISVGPLEPTPTKPGRAGTGVEYLKQASQISKVPFFVTGAVQPKKIRNLVSLGAKGFVVVRWITESENPFEASKQIRKEIDTQLQAKRIDGPATPKE